MASENIKILIKTLLIFTATMFIAFVVALVVKIIDCVIFGWCI